MKAEYIGKGAVGFYVRYSLDVANNTLALLTISKMIGESSLSKKKDVLTDLMKRNASRQLVRFYVYFGKNRADVGSRKRLFRAYAKFRLYFKASSCHLVKWLYYYRAF